MVSLEHRLFRLACSPVSCAQKPCTMTVSPSPAKRSACEPAAGNARREPVRTLAAVLPGRHRSSQTGAHGQTCSGHHGRCPKYFHTSCQQLSILFGWSAKEDKVTKSMGSMPNPGLVAMATPSLPLFRATLTLRQAACELLYLVDKIHLRQHRLRQQWTVQQKSGVELQLER